jgi:hypothetical protein
MLTAALLRRYGPAVAQAFLTRAEREARDEEFLAERDADPALSSKGMDPLLAPFVLSIRPAPGSPRPSRLERDIELVRAGLEAGREAAHAALRG